MKMTARTDAAADCRRVGEILNKLGEKWSMQVIVTLREGPKRFNELKRQVDGISQQMLTRTLKMLERDGFVDRLIGSGSPPRVDYTLTAFGTSLATPVQQLAHWAFDHLGVLHENRERYDLRHADDPDASKTTS